MENGRFAFLSCPPLWGEGGGAKSNVRCSS